MTRLVSGAVITTLLFSFGATAGAAGELEPARFLVRADAPRGAKVLADGASAPKGWAVIAGDPAADPAREAERLAAALGAEVVPDGRLDLALDPLFDEQWYLRNNGQTGGDTGADVGAIEAWEIGDGAGSVVAVIDTGVDVDHPDLAGRLWDNPAEIGGNGIDDDGNGLVDDDVGWDFVDGDADPTDANGHGTKVTGLIGADRSDVGMAGLASGSKLMILRACTAGCAISHVAAAIDYAVDAGADVVNLSLGGNTAGLSVLEQAVDRAGAAGVLVVAAAGNSGVDLSDEPFYPASFASEYIVAVGASDNADRLATFSNTSVTDVDLVAPGVDLLTTFTGSDWGLDSGTSYAAPLVAATLTMVSALRPDLDAQEVKAIVLDTAELVPDLAGTSMTGGRLAAGAAMASAARVTARASVSPQFSEAPSVITFDASDSSGPIESIQWRVAGSVTSGTSVDLRVEEPSPVTGTVTITGVADRSGTAEVTAYVGENFDDADDSVFWADIIWLSANGHTDGCSASSFCPDRRVRRGEAAALMRRTLGIPLASQSSAFEDDNGSPFEADLAALDAVGVVRGCDPPANRRACPDELLTRGEMAALIVRALGLPRRSANSFTDDDGSVFEADIGALAAAGITRGCNPPDNDRFCPADPVTRGELAAFLHRIA